MSNTSVIVIDTAINQLETKVSLKTICCLRLIVYKLSFTKLQYFFSYMETCIAIIMYCQRLFLLFTGKQYCKKIFFFRGPTCNEYVFMQNLKFGGVMVLAVQLFNKRKKEKKTKNLKRTCFAVFPRCYVEIHFLGEFILFLCFVFFFVCFVTRNGNNLKLKVKSEFSLSMGNADKP